MKEIFQLIKLCIEKIKDEFLLFSIVALLLMVAFPDYKLYIFLIFIISVIAYFVLNVLKLKQHNQDNRFIYNFENFLLDRKNWQVRNINGIEIYFYINDNNYKIVPGEEPIKEWTPKIESWTEHFSDSSVFEYRVYLKHGESTIEEYTFMSCDGGRYFIPIPKKICIEQKKDFGCNKFEYVWHRDSIEYKIANVIGSFYRYKNLEQVAEFCGIIIK